MPWFNAHWKTVDTKVVLNKISTGSERGLLGLAFHPNYASNGFFYVHYTDTGGDVIVARYLVSANPEVANPGSEVILKTIPPRVSRVRRMPRPRI